MIYILDHHDAVNHVDFCKVIESELQPLEVVEVCSTLQFLFEDVSGFNTCLNMDYMLDILVRYFNIKDVKLNYSSEVLKHLPLPIKGSILERAELPRDPKVCLVDLEHLKSLYSYKEHKELLVKWITQKSMLEKITEDMRKWVSKDMAPAM